MHKIHPFGAEKPKCECGAVGDLDFSATALSDLFKDSQEGDEVHHVTLVGKSQYSLFKDNVINKLDSSTIETIKGVSGINLEKFPGPKVIKLDQKQYAMYNDQCGVGKINFGELFSQIKHNKEAISFTAFGGEELKAPIANRLSYAWTAHNYKLTAYRRNVMSKEGAV